RPGPATPTPEGPACVLGAEVPVIGGSSAPRTSGGRPHGGTDLGHRDPRSVHDFVPRHADDVETRGREPPVALAVDHSVEVGIVVLPAAGLDEDPRPDQHIDAADPLSVVPEVDLPLALYALCFQQCYQRGLELA